MIALDNITWRAPQRGYSETVERFSLWEISVEIPSKTYAVMMGPTGCGKTSLLEIICGLRPPQSGRVILDGKDVTLMEPRHRAIGYVPQDIALFPNLRVRDQIAFAPRVSGSMNREEIESLVSELAGSLGITKLLGRFPDALSGGEKQRVAIGRALAAKPRVLLLDEPLSALDEEMREDLMKLLQQLKEDFDLTVLHVTHSLSESRALGEMQLRLRDGRLREAT
jgi:ABC-type sugar transport system ATPase subunit